MNSLTYTIKGEGTDRIVTLKVDSQMIYEGYAYSLVTSVDGVLQFKLNFGLSGVEYLYRMKNIEDYLLLLPVNEQFRDAKQIIFSKSSLMKLWDELGYDFEDDKEYITAVNHSDILCHWFLSSGIYFEQLELESMRKEILKKTVGYSEEKYQYLFENLISIRDDIQFNGITKIRSSCVEISIYLDQKANYDWKAFFIDEQGAVYINISPKLGLKTNISIN
ncbi:hypothetical protein [Paenibacillus campi]|uniref:hypothetical protein n=1 Tax=Paenibacillus campi TaxID=3106031 RepID=UPI002AFF3D34|nr:hypothetical protein [Paenibacillus sp. SGZ-1009]